MSMMRWDPFAEMTTLRQAVDQLLENSFIRPGGGNSAGGFGIPIDLIEQGDTLVVKASLPGVKPADVQVQVEQNVLTITGEQHEAREREQGRYYLAERHIGRMSRSIALPIAVDTDASSATVTDGVLTLTLPKAEQARSKQIAIRPSPREVQSSEPVSTSARPELATADRG
jgi:HSP20 family protein